MTFCLSNSSHFKFFSHMVYCEDMVIMEDKGRNLRGQSVNNHDISLCLSHNSPTVFDHNYVKNVNSDNNL